MNFLLSVMGTNEAWNNAVNVYWISFHKVYWWDNVGELLVMRRYISIQWIAKKINPILVFYGTRSYLVRLSIMVCSDSK